MPNGGTAATRWRPRTSTPCRPRSRRVRPSSSSRCAVSGIASTVACRNRSKLFVEQEAAHTREHVVFNKLIKSAGYDTSAMDAEIRRRLDVARSRHPVGQLAITVALEHFTAIMAHSFVDRERSAARRAGRGAATVAMACHRRNRTQGGGVRHLPAKSRASCHRSSAGSFAAR